MTALRMETGDGVHFSGVGGNRMTEAGLNTLFPMEDLSVMGFAEILPRLFLLKRRIRQTAKAALEEAPDALVTIDSPGFALRVASRLKGCGTPLIHYVAPQVWAWRPQRVRRIATIFDRILALLPFEPPYFENEGLPCNFVGHSVVEDMLTAVQKQDISRSFRTRYQIEPEQPVLLLLPGSRKSEVGRLLPVFCDTVRLLRERIPGIRTIIPTLPQVEELVRSEAGKHKLQAIIVTTTEEKQAAFAAANCALAASGTVSLELAAAEVPTVIGYRVNPISAWIGRKVVNVQWITLTNIILNKPLIPEFIQGACRPEALFQEVFRLLSDPDAQEQQRVGAQEVLKLIGAEDDVPPSCRAAQAILDAIERRP